jgi:Mitochondrial domain of unknown function (DUF1713)
LSRRPSHIKLVKIKFSTIPERFTLFPRHTFSLVSESAATFLVCCCCWLEAQPCWLLPYSEHEQQQAEKSSPRIFLSTTTTATSSCSILSSSLSLSSWISSSSSYDNPLRIGEVASTGGASSSSSLSLSFPPFLTAMAPHDDLGARTNQSSNLLHFRQPKFEELPPLLPVSLPIIGRVLSDKQDDDDDSSPSPSLTSLMSLMSSTLKKRRTKMNKHKLKKRRKLLRLKSK